MSKFGDPTQLLKQLFPGILIQQEENKSLSRKYRHILRKSDTAIIQQQLFMKTLYKNVIRGDDGEKDVLIQLKLIERKRLKELLTSFKEADMNLLQLAAFCYADEEATVIKEICKLEPSLIWEQRSGAFKGQTALHLAIVKGNEGAVEFLLQEGKDKQSSSASLLDVAAIGSSFESTVMMGELPLSVAALTFKWEIVETLINNGADFSRGNSIGDTVFHSLLRFAKLYPANIQDVLRVVKKLHRKIVETYKSISKVDARDVWLIENNEGLTPLRLAVKTGQPELFKFILNLEGVYRHLDISDGFFDLVKYDITEVDPLALRHFKSVNKNKQPEPPSSNDVLEVSEPTAKTQSQNAIRAWFMKSEATYKPRNVSVLEIICEQNPDKELFEIISTDVIRAMIGMKWKRYRVRFLLWAFFHFVFMSVLSTYSVYRSRIIGDELKSSQTGALERTFVTTVACISLFAPILVVLLEIVMRFRHMQHWKLQLLHHNGHYRLMLVLFSGCLAADAIWFLVPGTSQNYLILFSLLVGWWFMIFFLRPYRPFSFFTVMLQRVFFGDMLRFCVIIILMWVAFSVAMHSAYLARSDPEPPQEFRDIWTSALTMFQLLVGMADSGKVLGESDKVDFVSGKVEQEGDLKWLPVVLYVSYILLSYILMLNALIAMMSRTCSTVSKDRDRQWQYQRLSVVLMIECLTPTCCEPMTRGVEQEVDRFDFRFKRFYREKRYFLKVKAACSATQKSPGKKDATDEGGSDDSHHLALLAAFAKQQFTNDSNMPIIFDRQPNKDTTRTKQDADSANDAIIAAMVTLCLKSQPKGEQPTENKGGSTGTGSDNGATTVAADFLANKAAALVADYLQKQKADEAARDRDQEKATSSGASRADKETTRRGPPVEQTKPGPSTMPPVNAIDSPKV